MTELDAAAGGSKRRVVRITEERLRKLGFVRIETDEIPHVYWKHEPTGLEIWDGGWNNREWIVNQFDQGGMQPNGIFTMRAVRILIKALTELEEDNRIAQVRI